MVDVREKFLLYSRQGALSPEEDREIAEHARIVSPVRQRPRAEVKPSG